jgi:hypothetical protein
MPSEFEPVTAAPSVDLTYRNRRVLTGTVGRRPVELTVRLPTSSGAARGRFGSAPVAVTWRMSDDRVTLMGTLDGRPVTLSVDVRRDPDWWFDSGDLSGDVGPIPVSARIERADGGLSDSTVYAEGAVGRGAFALWATIAGNRRRGFVRGSVDGRPIDLAVATQGRHLRITGGYEGAYVLLALIAGTFAHFM